MDVIDLLIWGLPIILGIGSFIILFIADFISLLKNGYFIANAPDPDKILKQHNDMREQSRKENKHVDRD